MNQNEQVLDMLRRGPVTPFDALTDAGCFRLAARVSELREQGHAIHTELKTEGGKRHAVYSLLKTNAA